MVDVDSVLMPLALQEVKGRGRGRRSSTPFAIRVRMQLPISSPACYMQI